MLRQLKQAIGFGLITAGAFGFMGCTRLDVWRQSRRIEEVMQSYAECGVALPSRPTESCAAYWDGGRTAEPSCWLSNAVGLYDVYACLEVQYTPLLTKLVGKGPETKVVRTWYAVARGEPNTGRPNEIVWISKAVSAGWDWDWMEYERLEGGGAKMTLWVFPGPVLWQKPPSTPGARRLAVVIFNQDGRLVQVFEGRQLKKLDADKGTAPPASTP